MFKKQLKSYVCDTVLNHQVGHISGLRAQCCTGLSLKTKEDLHEKSACNFEIIKDDRGIVDTEQVNSN